jgi:hypothetical protein
MHTDYMLMRPGVFSQYVTIMSNVSPQLSFILSTPLQCYQMTLLGPAKCRSPAQEQLSIKELFPSGTFCAQYFYTATRAC